MLFKLQISILGGFLKDHVTLKTAVMILKIQRCHHRNKLHLKCKYYSRYLRVILYCNYISQYYCWNRVLTNVAFVSTKNVVFMQWNLVFLFVFGYFVSVHHFTNVLPQNFTNVLSFTPETTPNQNRSLLSSKPHKLHLLQLQHKLQIRYITPFSFTRCHLL